MKSLMGIYKNLMLMTQFGISLVTPLLLCLGLCVLLTQHTGLGGWIYIPGFFFGLGGSAMVAYKLYLGTIQKEEKEKKNKKVCFNRHS